MGIGKILTYTAGGAIIGVAAIAAAPFTGGGSVAGAVSLGASLVGAGAAATGAGVTGAGVTGAAFGYAMSRKEDEEENARDEKIAELNKKAKKYEEEFKKAIEQFQGDKEYFNYIIGATALGISMANVDGEISPEEVQEIEEFIGGIASSNYPPYIKNIIENLYVTKPNFNTAMAYLERVNPSNYISIRNLLELIMVADGIVDDKEVAFLKAFDTQISMIKYNPEDSDIQNGFLLEAKSRF